MPCDECPLQMLEDQIAGSPQGAVLKEALELSNAKELGFKLDLGEVSPPVLHGMRVLAEEKARKWEEDNPPPKPGRKGLGRTGLGSGLR